MQRIPKLETATAPGKAAELLAAVKKQMGGVPAILQTMAQSPAALAGYLGFAGGLAGGMLSPALREQIALTVAGVNACDYCASAHTALGRRAGLSSEELALNLKGESTDARTSAALAFVGAIVDAQGHIAEADLAEVRAAGYGNEEIVEMIAHTALNIFTNYFNHIAATEIDFPVVSTLRPAA